MNSWLPITVVIIAITFMLGLLIRFWWKETSRPRTDIQQQIDEYTQGMRRYITLNGGPSFTFDNNKPIIHIDRNSDPAGEMPKPKEPIPFLRLPPPESLAEEEDKPDPNEIYELVRVQPPRYLTPADLQELPERTRLIVWRTGRTVASHAYTDKEGKRVILLTIPKTNIDMDRFGQSREKGPVAKLWTHPKSDTSRKNDKGPSRA